MAQSKRAGSKPVAIIATPEPTPDLAAMVSEAAHHVASGSPAPTELPAAETAPVADFQEPAPAPEPVADETEAMAADAPTLTQQGTDKMATTFETATATAQIGSEKFQAMFGDANTRAKTAMEKGTKIVEELTALTKGNVEALVQSGRVAAKGAETIGQDAAEYGRKSFEHASTSFKSFASVKSPAELFQLQSDYAKSAFDAMVGEASKFSENYVKLMGDVFEPISGRIQLAADKIKSTAL